MEHNSKGRGYLEIRSWFDGSGTLGTNLPSLHRSTPRLRKIKLQAAKGRMWSAVTAFSRNKSNKTLRVLLCMLYSKRSTCEQCFKLLSYWNCTFSNHAWGHIIIVTNTIGETEKDQASKCKNKTNWRREKFWAWFKIKLIWIHWLN